MEWPLNWIARHFMFENNIGVLLIKTEVKKNHVQCSELSEWPCQDAWQHPWACSRPLADDTPYYTMYINYFLYKVKDFQLVKILSQHRNGIWLKKSLYVTFVREKKLNFIWKSLKPANNVGILNLSQRVSPTCPCRKFLRPIMTPKK
jgi:hypothetical protein